jgi:hypothetical protein
MYTLDNVCSILKIDPATLWRWCRRARIKPFTQEGDNRQKYLTDEQFIYLARQHRCLVVPPIGNVQLIALERLEARIRELENELRNAHQIAENGAE